MFGEYGMETESKHDEDKYFGITEKSPKTCKILSKHCRNSGKSFIDPFIHLILSFVFLSFPVGLNIFCVTCAYPMCMCVYTSYLPSKNSKETNVSISDVKST